MYTTHSVCTQSLVYNRDMANLFICTCAVLIFRSSGTYRLIAGALMPTIELEQSERQGKRLRSDSSHSWRAGFDENSPTPPPSPVSTGLRGRENEEGVEGGDEEKVSGM